MAGSNISRDEWKKFIEDWFEADKQYVGKPTPITPVPLNRLVSVKDIRDYAWGLMGDPDPLFTNPDYGKTTRWGGMIAPPTFIHRFGIDCGKINLPDIPGSVFYHGDTSFDFSSNRPIRPGDEIYVFHKYLGLTERSDPNMPFRRFFKLGEGTGYNQRGEVVFKCKMNAKIDLTYPGDLPKYTEALFKDREVRPLYTEEQIEAIHQYYEDELAGKHHRGAEILYWEDVQVGDEIPTQITGPYVAMDASYSYGALGTFATAWPMAKERSDRGFRDESGEWLGDISWHFLDVPSQQIGVPAAHSFAAQNEGNICHGLCNWKGDDGWLKRWYIEQISPRFFGDMGNVKGKVKKKYIEDEEHVVDLDIWLENQSGVVNAGGNCTVRLISRED